jgi:cellulose synthase/poly-beta-1,6-N-acetylglucosamine synthase-like glycosyltransferase
MNSYLLCMYAATFLLIYPYAIYPLIVRLLAQSGTEACADAPTDWPMVSIVISFLDAHEAVQRKVENLLQLDYPPERWEVIFVSDGANHQTVDYLAGLDHPQVRVLDLGERVGKTEAENRARVLTSGEISVFTDCGTVLDKDVLKNLIRRFADPRIGAVSTVDMIYGESGCAVKEGESAYVNQEMRLRDWETSAGIMVGLSGSCYACRREVYLPLAPKTTRDLATGLISLQKGYVNVSALNAFCSIKAQSDIKREFSRKIRTINNGIATVLEYKDLLNVFKYGRVSFAIWSHKVLRWMSFPLLMVILAASFLGLPQELRWAALVAQLFIYLSAIVFYFSGKVVPFAPLRIVIKFVIASLAASIAIVEIVMGKRHVIWKPTER